LREASARQDKEGYDSLAMPAREMLADMLLALKQPAAALDEYKLALKNSPKRFDALYGAARAAQAAGDAKAAQEYDTQLLHICGPGADRPEVPAVRASLMQLRSGQ
jgi:tetratricopeptide (TPR) repeat protein